MVRYLVMGLENNKSETKFTYERNKKHLLFNFNIEICETYTATTYYFKRKRKCSLFFIRLK